MAKQIELHGFRTGVTIGRGYIIVWLSLWSHIERCTSSVYPSICLYRAFQFSQNSESCHAYAPLSGPVMCLFWRHRVL